MVCWIRWQRRNLNLNPSYLLVAKRVFKLSKESYRSWMVWDQLWSKNLVREKWEMGNLVSRAEITEADKQTEAEGLLPFEELCLGTGEKIVNISWTSYTEGHLQKMEQMDLQIMLRSEGRIDWQPWGCICSIVDQSVNHELCLKTKNTRSQVLTDMSHLCRVGGWGAKASKKTSK